MRDWKWFRRPCRRRDGQPERRGSRCGTGEWFRQVCGKFRVPATYEVEVEAELDDGSDKYQDRGHAATRRWK